MGTFGDYQCRPLNEQEAEITRYTGSKTDVFVPAIVGDANDRLLRVVRIGDGAFAGHAQIKTLHLPCTLREIGSRAFSGCGALRWLEMIEGVSEVAMDAFEGCSGLCTIEQEGVCCEGDEEEPKELPASQSVQEGRNDMVKRMEDEMMKPWIGETERHRLDMENGKVHVPFMRLEGEENQGDQPVECLIYEYRTKDNAIHRVMAVMHSAHCPPGTAMETYRWFKLAFQEKSVLDEQGDLLLPQGFAEGMGESEGVVVLQRGMRIDVWKEADWLLYGRGLSPDASSRMQFRTYMMIDETFTDEKAADKAADKTEDAGAPGGPAVRPSSLPFDEWLDQMEASQTDESFSAPPEEAYTDPFDYPFDEQFEHMRAQDKFFARRRRKRMKGRTKRAAVLIAAALALALLVWACVRLLSPYALVRAYDEEATEHALFMMEDVSRQFWDMTERMLMYVEMASELTRGLPDSERAHMMDETWYNGQQVSILCGMAHHALGDMARSGSILRSTRQSVDLRDADVLLREYTHGAERMHEHVKAAARMMEDGEIWEKHGAGMLDSLRELSEGYYNLALYGQAGLYRQFMTEEEMQERPCSGRVRALMMHMDEASVFEQYKEIQLRLLKTEAALEAYEAEAEAALLLMKPAPEAESMPQTQPETGDMP